MEIDFAVLGPWQVKSTDGELTVPVGHLRTLLALILLAGGEPVPIATLAEHLWGDRQPAKARSALTTYVARLRQVLGPDTILTCLGIGYRLGVPAARVDLHRFRELVQDSRQTASAEGELSMLLEALNLWRGQPFTGIDSPWLDHDVVPALAEEWLTATERRIDLELARGPSSALITELRKLTQTYPLRESLWCRLILVLHAAGRRADALTTYQQIRAALSEEIGLDPCEELQRAHLFVLRDNGSAETTAAGELPTGPHQLPYDNAKFSGRDRELAALDELLTDGQSASHPTTIVAIDGAPGTGKTTLAVHWAYRVKDRYPDVQVYLNLRGYSTADPVQPAAALEIVLRALGVATERIPADLDERSALLRSSLAGRRALVLLDNARDAAQVRPLIPSAGSLVVVTSRNQLRALSIRDGAHRVTLERLGTPEAVALLGTIVGPERVDAEPAAAAELTRLCDGLPLALAVVAERVQRADSIGAVADALADEKERLDALGAGSEGDPHTDLRAALAWSYQALDPVAAGMFRRLGLHPPNEFGAEVAAALADLPVRQAKEALDRLVAAHMVEQRRPDRYELHDLIRLYAADQARQHDSFTELHSAVGRVCDWYLHATVAADRMLTPHRRRAFVEPYEPTMPVPEFGDQSAAMAWFEREYDTLCSVSRWAAARGWASHAWRIAISMVTFLDRRIPWREGIELLEAALHAARSVEDRVGAGYTLNSLGCIHLDQGGWEQARACYEKSVECFREVFNVPGEAMALGNLGLTCSHLGEYEQGQRIGLVALELSRKSGYRRGVAQNLDNLGVACAGAGDHQGTLEYHRRADVIFQEFGERDATASSLYNLGLAYAASGQYTQAIRCFRRTLGLFRALDSKRWEALALLEIARTLGAARHPQLAARFLADAQVLMAELGDHPRAFELQATLRKKLQVP
ncbi:BTAD domain-containing putative transcriptional regulator [Fodinicola feengrottensis]|uniref:BTAD domain-containing putative transcriptional regulator n=1 Tax=Fodinicola feengrottensis TaxID=435914 RepID=A0ABP4S2Y2_9ACTN